MKNICQNELWTRLRVCLFNIFLEEFFFFLSFLSVCLESFKKSFHKKIIFDSKMKFFWQVIRISFFSKYIF